MDTQKEKNDLLKNEYHALENVKRLDAKIGELKRQRNRWAEIAKASHDELMTMERDAVAGQPQLLDPAPGTPT